MHVIEVKKVIARRPGRDWSESAELAQLRWYADRLDTAGTLIDSHRLVLLEQGAAEPVREVVRQTASNEDRESVRAHILARWVRAL